MGRLGLRAGWDMTSFDIVQINEIATDARGSAHLLKFDSVHGTWQYETNAEENRILIGENKLAYSSNATIGETDWSNCDIVIEATGKHHKKTGNAEQLFRAGSEKSHRCRAYRRRIEHCLWHQ
jgi:glyceraldehyde 3-phosphate dehydrogenase